MPKYQIEIVHTSGHTIEAEDHDHALEIAAELSDDIKSRKYFMFGEWRATEIKEISRASCCHKTHTGIQSA